MFFEWDPQGMGHRRIEIFASFAFFALQMPAFEPSVVKKALNHFLQVREVQVSTKQPTTSSLLCSHLFLAPNGGILFASLSMSRLSFFFPSNEILEGGVDQGSGDVAICDVRCIPPHFHARCQATQRT